MNGRDFKEGRRQKAEGRNSFASIAFRKKKPLLHSVKLPGWSAVQLLFHDSHLCLSSALFAVCRLPFAILLHNFLQLVLISFMCRHNGVIRKQGIFFYKAGAEV